MDWLYDERTQCWSLQTTMTIGEYVDLINDAHQTRGALSGQRDVLTTTTAKRIRARMVADIKLGAVLPPVVIGAVIEDDVFNTLPIDEADSVNEVLGDSDLSSLSIIDGMQRTAAMLEAQRDDPTVSNRRLRIEFWLATTVRAMIYRMLVLNTGQVPWTISRQLTVVFSPLLEEIQRNVPDLAKLSTPDDRGRRVGGGQYASDDIVELYIAFSLRKTAVDAKEAVSDEFSRLDFVDNLSDTEFQAQFYEALGLLARLDKSFSRYEPKESTRYTRGRDIFGGQPARIGFIVAIATAVLGRPGANRLAEQRGTRLTALKEAQNSLIEKLDGLNEADLAEFIRLDVLREVLDRRVGQVGRYERAVFAEAFKVLVEEKFALDSLEPCWRAN
ncbi:hypothetical protein [Actinoplanes lobatus]|nr:hypothetical protein [Actinoplanes lobatus]MBB4750058.1 hypothetical protein [Actinoplanes lobatus]